MSVEQLELTEEQLRELDAQYKSFPGVAEWPDSVFRPDLWDNTHLTLERTRDDVSPDDLERALEFVMRAAALDTGAIEGLYTVDRGFTITVAAQAIAWQAEVERRGEQVRALFEAQLRAYELVLDVATKRLPVTEAWIRRLHEVVTAPQETYVVHTAVGLQLSLGETM